MEHISGQLRIDTYGPRHSQPSAEIKLIKMIETYSMEQKIVIGSEKVFHNS